MSTRDQLNRDALDKATLRLERIGVIFEFLENHVYKNHSDCTEITVGFDLLRRELDESTAEQSGVEADLRLLDEEDRGEI